MSDWESYAQEDSNRSTTSGSETLYDRNISRKSYSDPKLLFRRPPRRHQLLRPNGMLLTKVDGSQDMVYNNPDNHPQNQEQVFRLPLSRPSQKDDAESNDKHWDVSSEACSTQVTEVEEDSEEESDPCSDSEDYDTDLDPDTTVSQMFREAKAWQDPYDNDYDNIDAKHDPVRLREYRRECHNHQAVPQTAILRHIGDRDLDLRHRNMGGKDLEPLFRSLRDNMRIQRLLLDENGLGEEAMKGLARGLRDNVTLSYLSLSGNPLGSKGVAHVVDLLLFNKIIQGLDVSDTKLHGDAILLLARLLKDNETLKFLDLSKNTLEENLIRFLAAAIGENCGLEFLRLAWNNIRQSGAAAIGQSIMVNDTLRVLDLSWNGLGYKGAVTMAKSLKENESLQELDISQNNINWQGALILSSALAKNSTLKILRIGGNPLTTTGANDLVEAASSLTCHVRLLDLMNVPVIFETEMLASSISEARSFRLHHGGVVYIHDILGRRLEREKTPMERLLGHLKGRMMRPLEMLREFDKKSNGRITQAQFMARLKKANVPLHGFEIRELVASVSDMQLDGCTKINYKKLIEGVENHIMEERMRKIKERMYQKRVQDYHTRILSESKPLYVNALANGLDTPSAGASRAWGSHSPLSTGRLSKELGTALLTRASAQSLGSVGNLIGTQPLTLPQLSKPGKLKLSQALDEIGVKAKRKKALKKKVSRKTGKKTGSLGRETTTLVGSLNANQITVS